MQYCIHLFVMMRVIGKRQSTKHAFFGTNYGAIECFRYVVIDLVPGKYSPVAAGADPSPPLTLCFNCNQTRSLRPRCNYVDVFFRFLYALLDGESILGYEMIH